MKADWPVVGLISMSFIGPDPPFAQFSSSKDLTSPKLSKSNLKIYTKLSGSVELVSPGTLNDDGKVINDLRATS